MSSTNHTLGFCPISNLSLNILETQRKILTGVLTQEKHHVFNIRIGAQSSGIYQQAAFITLALIVLIFLTYSHSFLKFQASLKDEGSEKLPPTVPYYIPFFAHLFSFVSNPAKFLAATVKGYGYLRPLVLRAGFFEICVISDPHQIETIFKQSKYLTSKPSTILALTNIFATPKSVIPFYDADDSGMAAKPKKGSIVEQKNRVHYWQASLAQKYLSGQYLWKISKRYFEIIQKNLNASNIQHEWVELPDLYRFLQMEVSRASIETMCGSHIFRINPNLVEDFWTFESQVPTLVCGLPEWMTPKACKVRRKLLDGIKAWHAFAHEHSDCSKIQPEDPDWDPYFGIQLVKARQYHNLRMDSMDADARASEDLGLLFAGNANIVPAIFWYIFEAIKDKDLQKRLLEEVAPCEDQIGGYDMELLSSKPLLQSAYAEVLRLRIAITMSRTPEYNDFKLGDYVLPKNSRVVMFSRTSALNEAAWKLSGRPLGKPLEEFWADRFLVFGQLEEGYKNEASSDDTKSHASLPPASQPNPQMVHDQESESKSKPIFSMDRTAGIWLPYGGGQRMCPGRHFSKQEILGTFALLLGKYEIQLGDIDSSKVQPDMRWASLGGLPPVCKVPARIRKRV